MAKATKARSRSEIWRSKTLSRAIEAELGRLGGRLRELRHGREWTLEQAAEKAKIHAVTLSRVECGESNVTVATLVSLARVYGVSLSELFPAP